MLRGSPDRSNWLALCSGYKKWYFWHSTSGQEPNSAWHRLPDHVLENAELARKEYFDEWGVTVLRGVQRPGEEMVSETHRNYRDSTGQEKLGVSRRIGDRGGSVVAARGADGAPGGTDENADIRSEG